MDPVLQAIIKNQRFNTMNREETATIRFPRVSQTGPPTLLVDAKAKPTDVTTLKTIPSRSVCEEMMTTLHLGKYEAFSCILGTFNAESLSVILNIHSIKEVSQKVLQEKVWLAKKIVPPSEKCSYTKSVLMSFGNLLWNNPDGHTVLSYSRSLLSSDLALLCGTQWLNLSLLATIAKLLSNVSEETVAFMLNDLLVMDDKCLRQTIRQCSKNTKHVILFANVGCAEDVFFSTPQKPGCHWTLIYVDLTTNTWYYCDTGAWGMPKGIAKSISPVVAAFYEEHGFKSRPFRGCVDSHAPGKTSPHHCSPGCLQNIPLQTCANVCGVAAATLASIAVAAPRLWQKVFLSKTAKLPEELEWLMRPSRHSDFLRASIASWLVNGRVDVCVLGISDSTIPQAKAVRPQHAHSKPTDWEKVVYKRRRRCSNDNNPACTPVIAKHTSRNPTLKRRHRRKETIDLTMCDGGMVVGDGKNEVQGKMSNLRCNDNNVVHNKKEDQRKTFPNVLDNDNVEFELNNVTQNEKEMKGKRRTSPLGVDGNVHSESDTEERRQTPPLRADDDNVVYSDSKIEEKKATFPLGIDDDNVHSEIDVEEKRSTSPLGIDDDNVHSESDVEEKRSTSPLGIDDDNVHSESDVEEKRSTSPLGIDDDNVHSESDVEEKRSTSPLGVDDDDDAIYSENDIEVKRRMPPLECDDDNMVNGNSRMEDKRNTPTMECNHTDGECGDSPLRSSDRNYASAVDKEKDGPTCRGQCSPQQQNVEDKSNSDDKEELFYVGRRITSIEEFEKIKKEYEDHNYCELWKKDVRSLEAAKKRVPKRVSLANPSLHYYSLLLYCKFGGEARKKKQRTRNTKTFRQGCPFEIYIMLSADGQALEVIRANTKHNHALQKEIYKHLPRQRTIPEEHKKTVREAIELKANSKLLQQKIEQTTGLKTTLKDISNIKQKTRSDVNKNDLDSVVDFLKRQNGSVAEVIIDEENNFKGLFYQDEYMKNMYSKFPELLLVDATYKLLDLRLPVYLLLCVDGDGLSEIAGMFLLAEETKEVIESAVTVFKKFNDKWNHTKVIMADKDFTERDAFTSCFPGASLNICLYHTLRSFRREITCEKMGISSAERLRCLEVLTQVAYSRSSKQYEKHLEALNNIRSSVKEYIELNWLPIKDQWVSCFKDRTLNLGENTNNRLESMFSKIKSVCSKYASLMQFFHEFFSVLKSLRNERKHHYIMALTRKPIEYKTLEINLQLYSDLLTPYSFEYVRKQFVKANTVVGITKTTSDTFKVVSSEAHTPLITTSSTCTCSFANRMELPCRHIFKARALLRLPLFDSRLVNRRWTKDYYKMLQDTVLKTTEMNQCEDFKPSKVFVSTPCKGKKILSQAQKFRKALQSAQAVASLLSECGMPTFEKRHNILLELCEHWKYGTEVTVHPIKETRNDYHVNHNIPRPESVENVKRVNDKPKETVGQTSQANNQTADLHTDPSITGETGPFSYVKMPPKMRKRGRPKGAEVTVIGLPKAKKSKESKHLLPFPKLSPVEKDRIVIECFAGRLVAAEAIGGQRLLHVEDVFSDIHQIPDLVRDNKHVDINRIQKYFSSKGWLTVLSILDKKQHSKWVCSICSKVISTKHNSIACDRCLLWFHFSCTSLTKQPKARNWFCKCCRKKYQ